jgi:hypothetical protein
MPKLDSIVGANSRRPAARREVRAARGRGQVNERHDSRTLLLAEYVLHTYHVSYREVCVYVTLNSHFANRIIEELFENEPLGRGLLAEKRERCESAFPMPCIPRPPTDITYKSREIVDRQS